MFFYDFFLSCFEWLPTPLDSISLFCCSFMFVYAFVWLVLKAINFKR